MERATEPPPDSAAAAGSSAERSASDARSPESADKPQAAIACGGSMLTIKTPRDERQLDELSVTAFAPSAQVSPESVVVNITTVPGMKPFYALMLTIRNPEDHAGSRIELPAADVQAQLFSQGVYLETSPREGNGSTRAEASGTIEIAPGVPSIGADFCAHIDFSLSFSEDGEMRAYDFAGEVSTVLMENIVSYPQGG